MLRPVRWATRAKKPALSAQPSVRHAAQPNAHQQLALFAMRPTLVRDSQPDLADSQLLVAVLHQADILAESRGWTEYIRRRVHRSLRLLIGTKEIPEPIAASTVELLRAERLPIERTCDVLAELGLLVDDRTSTLERYLARKTAHLPEQMQEEVRTWVDHLHDGGSRALPRSPLTIHGYLHYASTALTIWAARYRSLREVDRDAVKSVLGKLTGYRRSSTIVALRSLFRLLKQRHMIFRNPISHIKLKDPPRTIPTPLDEHALREAQQRATTDAHRLVFALVAVHALAKEDIRHLKLDAIDLHRGRLHLRGVDRPLDDFTGHAARAWLQERQRRWPTTTNPYLIITQQTANELGPVSGYYLKKPFANTTATLARLREDRLLDEVRHAGPDPLHLAAVFGLSASAAEGYIQAYRAAVEDAYSQRDP